MEAAKRSSRKKRPKEKIENYYKILGIRSNATQAAIKQKYIEGVKSFPPETHPEQFQQIRKAYETLRDPVKRSEYDMLRKYGDKIEKILEKAMDKLESGDWDESADLFRQAQKVSPDNLSACMGLAHVSLLQGEEETFQQQFRMGSDIASTEEEKVMVIGFKAGLLLEEGRAEEAIRELDHITSLYPQHAGKLHHLIIQAFIELDRAEEALVLAESAIPDEQSQEPEDIGRFINWINVIIEAEKWNLWGKAQSRLKKFLKMIQDEGDKFMVLFSLTQEFTGYYEAGRFREADMYMDLIYYMDSRFPLVQQARRDTQEMARIQREIERLQEDREIFPLISIHAFEWFYEGILEPDELYYVRSNVPPSLLDEMMLMKEELAAGVIRLKKKYPLVYRRYQEDWEEMYEEAVAGLNREARRRLR